jgi:hypothetical protein
MQALSVEFAGRDPKARETKKLLFSIIISVYKYLTLPYLNKQAVKTIYTKSQGKN